ncbi:T6SS effector BTH_I2691 family protein [Erwinia sp. V90_4]|uniref:T6SS effector BTH_I2691 family protein n=1 Tax=Erwinia sp. V90_4 TaxID=3044239 RepID=UPI00249EBE1C|nr:T6SS effector BTH_I2691 family protein [Erwinia sp. V90_4]MDI3439021.1 T6SS effector BTH_I2691 family protein [Erwinia sp. V90_4]
MFYRFAVKARQDEEVSAASSDATVSWIMAQAAVLKKLTGYYGSATKAQSKALEANASLLEQRLYRADAFVVTVGDRITQSLRVSAVGETLATTVFRMVLHVRAGIPLETVEAMVKSYLRGAPEMRARVLAGFGSARRFMTPQAEVMRSRQAMRSGLDDWLQSEEGRSKLKEARIGALLLVLNALDFVWLCSQLRDDRKPLSGVVASGLAVVSQTLALVTPAVEGGLKAGAVTVATVKGLGAAAGMLSSGWSLYTDGLAVSSELEKQRSMLAGIMFTKGVLDLLTGVKYTGTLLEVFDNKYAVKTAAAITKSLQVEIFGIRILAVLMTWEVQVAIVLLQVVVTLIEDNDLQVWCRHCVFGIEPADKSWNEQRKALDAAFKEII